MTTWWLPCNSFLPLHLDAGTEFQTLCLPNLDLSFGDRSVTCVVNCVSSWLWELVAWLAGKVWLPAVQWPYGLCQQCPVCPGHREGTALQSSVTLHAETVVYCVTLPFKSASLYVKRMIIASLCQVKPILNTASQESNSHRQHEKFSLKISLTYIW